MEELTHDRIKQIVNDTFFNTSRGNEFTIKEQCILKGIVTRTERNLDLCNDRKCPTCSKIQDEIERVHKNRIPNFNSYP